MRVTYFILAALILGSLAAYMLIKISGEKSPLASEIDEVKRATTTSGALLIEAPEPKTDALGLTATWTLELSEDWDSYTRSVKARLPRAFQTSATRPIFTRSLHGDNQALELEKVSDSGRTRVRVTFKSFPD